MEFFSPRFKKHAFCKNAKQFSLRKAIEIVSPILVTITSRNDSDFEHSNISLKELKPEGIDLNSNGLHYCVKRRKKFYDFQQTELRQNQNNRSDPSFMTLILLQCVRLLTAGLGHSRSDVELVSERSVLRGNFLFGMLYSILFSAKMHI